MERLATMSHNSFRAIGFQKRRSPSSPYGPARQGSQLITLAIFPNIFIPPLIAELLLPERLEDLRR